MVAQPGSADIDLGGIQNGLVDYSRGGTSLADGIWSHVNRLQLNATTGDPSGFAGVDGAIRINQQSGSGVPWAWQYYGGAWHSLGNRP
jgi:hypothetical protein